MTPWKPICNLKIALLRIHKTREEERRGASHVFEFIFNVWLVYADSLDLILTARCLILKMISGQDRGD